MIKARRNARCVMVAASLKYEAMTALNKIWTRPLGLLLCRFSDAGG
jgi:hypothetical protein